MSTLPPLTRQAVLVAIREFGRLGRDAFLSKYQFRKATTYFLVDDGRLYDAKAIVGAAYGFLPSRRRPLKWSDFGSRKVTTKRWLEQLDFKVVSREDARKIGLQRASSRLDLGNLYTRNDLRRLFSSRDATIMTGVFRPAGFRSVCLFVTEKKTADRTQFKDRLQGNTLQWEGQLSGRTDDLIAEHAQRDLELLLFYRREKYEYPGAAFRYEGTFRYVRHRGKNPTSFILLRESTKDSMESAGLAAEPVLEFDPTDTLDARQRALVTIAIRRGRRGFRNNLLRAYGHRCALTGCNHPEVLEAAHIYPYKGTKTNHVTNGLLLRADIHTLFDLGWISIDANTGRALIHPTLAATTYRTLAGRRVALPRKAADRPSRRALEWHYKHSRLKKRSLESIAEYKGAISLTNKRTPRHTSLRKQQLI